jgi:hypothetical protein
MKDVPVEVNVLGGARFQSVGILVALEGAGFRSVEVVRR